MVKLLPVIKSILKKLQRSGFEAYVVGGCVRDSLLGRTPQDWDIAVKASPEDVQKVFPNSFYANRFGTVTVQTDSQKRSLKEIEITSYRLEQKYTDKRHPDQVSFAQSIEEDLSRRDFTINALAVDIKGEIVDLFDGQKDLAAKRVKTVGRADERFGEDALRMLRAVRLAAQLGFTIEPATLKAIRENSVWLQAIAKERIRDELVKIIMGERPQQAFELLRESELLERIMPELVKGVGVSQNRHHVYTVYQHAVLSLQFAAEKKYGLEVRLAALLHDIAKPQTKEGEGPESTFYNHDQVGARFAVKILHRLRFPKRVVEKVALLVRHHMFVYGVGEVTESGVRRLLRRVGRENIDDLIKLRVADRLGSGCPKAVPYKLRHLKYLIEKVSSDPISVKMLKVNGDDLMKELGLKPGVRIGLLLDALLAGVLEKPALNTKKKLLAKAKKLAKLSDDALRKKNVKVKEKKEEEECQMKSKYWVQ